MSGRTALTASVAAALAWALTAPAFAAVAAPRKAAKATAAPRALPSGFLAYVSRNFVNNDTSGQAQNHSEFIRSVESDFKNLDQIQLSINSQSIQPQGERSIVSLNWNLRARFRQSGEEWVLTRQKSALTYEWSPEQGVWQLLSISGDPIFGLSNQLGALPVYRGKVDNVAINSSNAFGVMDGELGAGNAALSGFTSLSLSEGGRADLELAAGQMTCTDAGDGTRNLNASVTIKNTGRGAAVGTLRVEELVNGLGTLVQATAINLPPGAQITFDNGGAPVRAGLTPNSVCCAEIKLNSDGAIKEFDAGNNALRGLVITCP